MATSVAPPPLALRHYDPPVQRCPASDWVHDRGEFDVVQALLQRALPVSDAYPTLLPALVYRDFELLRYGVGAFFAEHADR